MSDIKGEPPTEEARRKYKKQMERAILKQLAEPHKVMRDQAMLARHERSQREEAERKAAEAERQAAERVQAAEQESDEKIAAVRREEAERYEALRGQALSLYQALKVVDGQNEELRTERDGLRESLAELRRDKHMAEMLASKYADRLTDIPMEEVMQHLGYGAERQGETYFYHDAQGRVVLRVAEQKLLDRRNEVICKNSLDLVVHMRRHNEGVEGYTREQALEWLRDEFGEKRARGAYLVNREHSVLDLFERQREERERTRPGQERDDQWRPTGRDDGFERTRQDDLSHDRGGGFSFDR